MSRLKKNIQYNIIGQLSILILGLVAVKSIFGNLGADVLGIIYFTATTNALFLVILDFGISATANREVSAHFKDESDYIHDLIRTGSLFYWGAFALVGIAVYFMAPIFVEKWINLKTLEAATAVNILRVLGITALCALPESLYFNLIKGLQRMEYSNIINVLFAALRQAGTILILNFGGNVYHVVFLYAVSYCLPILAYLIVLTKFFHLRAFLPGYSSKVLKKNLGFASKLTLQTIFLAIYNQFDKLIISKLMPIGLLGCYSFAQSNVRKATIIQSAIETAAYPSFCALFARGDRKRLMSQYRRLQDLVCFVNAPLLALISFAIFPVLSYTFNEDIAKQLLLPTILVCIGFYISATLRLPQQLAVAMGRPEIEMKTNGYSLIIMLPLTALLIYFWGLTGVGVAFILRRLYHYVFAVPKYCSECLRIPALEWYGHVLKFFILLSLTYGVPWLILRMVNQYSIPSLVITYMGATFCFLAGSYKLISDELKKTIMNYFRVVKLRIVRVS